MGTLVQRITLEGVNEIEAALAGLGQAGKAALDALSGGAQGVNTAFDQVGSAAGELSGIVGESFGRMAAPIQRVIHLLESFGGSTKGVAASLAGIAGAVAGLTTAFTMLGEKAAQAVVETERMAMRIGTSADQFEKFQFALIQTGVDGQRLVRVFATLDKEMAKTAEGGETALSKLGIAVSLTSGELRDPINVFKDIADKFQNMKDGAEKTALAAELFSKRVGPQMIPLLNQGAAGLDNLMHKAEDLGLTFSNNERKVALGTVLAYGQMSKAIDAFTDHLGLAFGDATTRVFELLTDWLGRNKDTFLGWARAVGDAVSSVVSDLQKIAAGQEDLVDNRWVIVIVDAFNDVIAIVKTFGSIVAAIFTTVKGLADELANGINAVFGTKINGMFIIIVGTITYMLIPALELAIATVIKLGAVAWANPILAALALVSIAVGELVTHWDAVTAAIQRAIDAIREFFGASTGGAEGKTGSAAGSTTRDSTSKTSGDDHALLDEGRARQKKEAEAQDKEELQRTKDRANRQKESDKELEQAEKEHEKAIKDAARAEERLQKERERASDAVNKADDALAKGLKKQAEVAEEGAKKVQKAQDDLSGVIDKAQAAANRGDADAQHFLFMHGITPDFNAGLGGSGDKWEKDFNNASDKVNDAQEEAGKKDKEAADNVTELAKAAHEAATALSALGGVQTTTADDGGGNAAGGLISGPGTASSDSIHARVSTGEYVVNAGAVSHYGAGLFHGLNARKFSLGGLVDMPAVSSLPSFAAGGLVPAAGGGGNTVHLNIGNEKFTLNAGNDTFAALSRFAVGSRLGSTGRKPSWVR